MIKFVLLWIVLASFSWAEMMPDVVGDACQLPGDVVLFGGRDPGIDLEGRGEAVTLEISDYEHDRYCKDNAACDKSQVRQSLGQGAGYRVITYSF